MPTRTGTPTARPRPAHGPPTARPRPAHRGRRELLLAGAGAPPLLPLDRPVADAAGGPPRGAQPWAPPAEPALAPPCAPPPSPPPPPPSRPRRRARDPPRAACPSPRAPR